MQQILEKQLEQQEFVPRPDLIRKQRLRDEIRSSSSALSASPYRPHRCTASFSERRFASAARAANSAFLRPFCSSAFLSSTPARTGYTRTRSDRPLSRKGAAIPAYSITQRRRRSHGGRSHGADILQSRGVSQHNVLLEERRQFLGQVREQNVKRHGLLARIDGSRKNGFDILRRSAQTRLPGASRASRRTLFR